MTVYLTWLLDYGSLLNDESSVISNQCPTLTTPLYDTIETDNAIGLLAQKLGLITCYISHTRDLVENK